CGEQREKAVKYIEDIEVTCEIFEEISNIGRVLENNGFHYVEEFTLDDIYLYDSHTKGFAPKGGKITDTLIIRYVNEDDKKIICKKRNYDENGFETSTDKYILRIKDIEEAQRTFNMLGYVQYLKMVDKNYMYESDKYIAYIQEIEDLGTFLELEAKSKEITAEQLIKYLKGFNLKTGAKFDVRKAEMLYKKVGEKAEK
ncbi:MAG: hypothetical protein HFJ45_10610, partial [Clostridia bacterium]|nr:hypothetical protein [Clostridia bacterium]